MDMLTTSTASDISPSPLGSRAKSIPSSIAMPLHAFETALQTFTAYRLAPGATPLWEPPSFPPMMSATWDPWPPAQGGPIAAGPQSIGSGSPTMHILLGKRLQCAGSGLGQTSPTKSNPPTPFAVGNNPSRVLFCELEVLVP